jgi:hypothetical protein
MGPIEVIVEAARKQEMVNIVYSKVNGETKSYSDLEPYSQRGNCLCLYDSNAGSIKYFKIDGIVSAESTGNTYSPRWDVEL